MPVREGKFDTTRNIKLIDFGNSWSTEQVSVQLGGKRKDSYAPPEEKRAVLPKNEASDAFGFGVLLLWLLTGPAVGASHEEVKNEKLPLLLAYFRRKAFDSEVRVIRRTLFEHTGSKNDKLASDLTDGLAAEQLTALRKLLPSNDATLAKLSEHEALITADELTLEDHLRKSLVTEYALQRRFDGRKPLDRAAESIGYWKTLKWLKRRLYRPCESMVYDPGEVTFEDASDQRKRVREKIFSSKNATQIYKQQPWIVDIISRCVSNDQARRPRIIDILRDLETYTSDSKGGGRVVNPFQAVSSHRYKVLDLPEPATEASDLEEMELDPQLDIKESRDVLIEYMSVCLRSLTRGDIYAAVTTLDMWQGQAFGHDGRFLTANIEALRLGASIRRVFIISLAELGSTFVIRMLVLLAKEIGLCEDKHGRGTGETARLTRSLEDIKDRNFVAFTSTNCPEGKRRAFACLLHHLRVALHDQLQFNIQPVSRNILENRDRSDSAYEQRLVARARFKRVLESYQYFFSHFDAQMNDASVGNIYFNPTQILPDEITSIRDFEQLPLASPTELPGLFLGLRLEFSLANAIKLRASCPRSIIQSQFVKWKDSDESRYIMLETEARGRGREKMLDVPELNRLRVYYSKLHPSPTIPAYQRIMYGLDRAVEGASPSHALPVVNLGWLVRDLVAVLTKMDALD